LHCYDWRAVPLPQQEHLQQLVVISAAHFVATKTAATAQKVVAVGFASVAVGFASVAAFGSAAAVNFVTIVG